MVETLICVQPFPAGQQLQEILCKDKLGRAAINKSSMVFDSDKEIMYVGCSQGRGGDGTLVPGAHSKQGQKAHPYNQCASEKGQRKLSPKKQIGSK